MFAAKLFFLACMTFLVPADAIPRLRRTTSDSNLCNSKTKYVRGFVRSMQNQLQCAGRPKPYWGQITQCSWRALERKIDFHWNECPAGYFLQNVDFNTYEFLCCKPVKHPSDYQARSIMKVNDKSEVATLCHEGYFVCGTFDKNCDNKICTTEVACCKMHDPLSAPKSTHDVALRIQDDTQVPLSFLAHFLGYGWCAGCRARTVGENFERTEQGWAADKSGTCEGYKADHRLDIGYSNWRYKQNGVRKWGGEITTDEPTVDSFMRGVIENNSTASQMFHVGDEISRKHSVRHTKLTSFTFAHDVGYLVMYSASLFGVEAGSQTSYNFHYEDIEERENEEENENTHTLTYGAEITVLPCTAIHYDIIKQSSRATTYFEASFQPLFSVHLDGFLRYGGGYHGDSTNYHESHRGSSDRPTVKYSFGNSERSFCEDLREQVDKRQQPWQWSNMMSKHGPIVTTVIDMLTNSSKHVFTVKAKVEEFAYTRADVQFREVPLPGCRVPESEGKTEEERSDLAHNFSKRSVREEDLSMNVTPDPDGGYRDMDNSTSPGGLDHVEESDSNSTKSPVSGDADPTGWSTSPESRPKVWTKSIDLRTGIWSDVDGLPSIPFNTKPKTDQTKQDRKEIIYFVDDHDLTDHDFEIHFDELPATWMSHGTMIIFHSHYYIPTAVIMTCFNVLYTKLCF